MSSCEAALSLDHVLDSVLSNLKQRERHRSAQVCRRFEAAATRLTTTEGLDMWFSDGEDVQRVASSLEPWWNKHASTLPSITMHDAWMFSSEPKPFMTQLSHLTRLDVCCAYMSTDVLSCLAGSLKVRFVDVAQGGPADSIKQGLMKTLSTCTRVGCGAEVQDSRQVMHINATWTHAIMSTAGC